MQQFETQSLKRSFQIFPETLQLYTGNIPTDSLNKLKTFVETENIKNGFLPSPKDETAKNDKKTSSWWSENLSAPLTAFLKKHFNNKREQALKDNQTGNAGVIAVRLTQKPEPNEDIVLNTGYKKENRDFFLLSGERLVFTSENWQQTAYLLVQLDAKLKENVTCEFKATSGNIPLAWSLTFYVCAGLFILFMVYHFFILPKPDNDKPVQNKSAIVDFFSTFGSFFSKKGVALSIAFILLYRLAEAQLIKIAPPFLLDAREIGGLGFSTSQVGFIYGTIGTLSLTAGGIIGGIAASRGGLKKWLWPMILSLNVTNLLYVYLSAYQPESIPVICTMVGIEQFGYGFGFTAFMLYLIYISQGKHATAHYAICTGFMALGMMLPGMMAGWLQETIGYANFFIWVCICTIPGFILVKKLKIDPNFGKKV